MPFHRTQFNAIESGLERFPILGPLFGRMINEVPPTLRQEITRQGMSGAIGAGAYLLGSYIDPEVAKRWQIGKFVSNMSGQFGMIARAGFMAGQLAQEGASPIQQGTKLLTTAVKEAPLPTYDAFTDMINIPQNLEQEGVPNPRAEEGWRQWLPRSVTPRFIPFGEKAAEQTEDLKRLTGFHFTLPQ